MRTNPIRPEPTPNDLYKHDRLNFLFVRMMKNCTCHELIPSGRIFPTGKTWRVAAEASNIELQDEFYVALVHPLGNAKTYEVKYLARTDEATASFMYGLTHMASVRRYHGSTSPWNDLEFYQHLEQLKLIEPPTPEEQANINRKCGKLVTTPSARLRRTTLRF